MSTESPPSAAVEISDDPAPNPPRRAKPLPPPHTGEDGATTAGGPNMVLLLVSGFIAYKVWRFRRRRASRAVQQG